jgi:DNA polymerase I-like protein with 3'-5' exonuclease and polymerase domains
MIEFDVETTGLQPWSGKHEAFLYIFYDGTTAEALEHFPSEGVTGNHERIQQWFDRGKQEGIRAWNAKFDRAFAEAEGTFDVPGDGCWHDGMVVAHTVDERRSVALKAVAKQLFGEEAADPQKLLKDWLNAENRDRRKRAAKEGFEFEPANFSHVPMEIMEPYALEDVILTRKISDVYDAALANAPDLQNTVEFERKAMDALFAIEKRGLPARDEEYRKLEQEVSDNLIELEERVRELADAGDPRVFAKELGIEVEVDETGRITSYKGKVPEFNPNSTQQIIAALKSRNADLSYMSEKNGKLSADAENLRAVDDELAAAILEFRSEYKVLSTYVRPMIGRTYESAMNSYKEPFIAPDSRIHANYRQVGARTGRMSCSDPNMQNQPRDDLRLRYNIVADPGYTLVTCDLSNIEMVLFAAYCGEGALLDAVRNGDDMHVLTAKMLGLRDRRRPGGGIETARQLGKTYNFSRIYGGGLRTIKRSFRCSMDEARLLKRRFDDAYPEVQRLQNRIQYKLEDDGYIQDRLISGRRFRVDVRDAYKATNYLVQGTAASLLKYAVIKLHEDGVPMVALVHDEIVAHVPVEDAKEVANLIETRMTEFEGLKGVVPLRADADIVTRWSDAKPLTEPDTGRKYLFDPEWANVERRYVA